MFSTVINNKEIKWMSTYDIYVALGHMGMEKWNTRRLLEALRNKGILNNLNIPKIEYVQELKVYYHFRAIQGLNSIKQLKHENVDIYLNEEYLEWLSELLQRKPKKNS